MCEQEGQCVLLSQHVSFLATADHNAVDCNVLGLVLSYWYYFKRVFTVRSEFSIFFRTYLFVLLLSALVVSVIFFDLIAVIICLTSSTYIMSRHPGLALGVS